MARFDTAEQVGGESIYQEALDTFERNFLLKALERCDWNVSGTARYLGVPLSTLKHKMAKLDIRELARRLRGA
jgi:DNA-binding NtrC family response regulator